MSRKARPVEVKKIEYDLRAHETLPRSCASRGTATTTGEESRPICIRSQQGLGSFQSKCAREQNSESDHEAQIECDLGSNCSRVTKLTGWWWILRKAFATGKPDFEQFEERPKWRHHRHVLEKKNANH